MDYIKKDGKVVESTMYNRIKYLYEKGFINKSKENNEDNKNIINTQSNENSKNDISVKSGVINIKIDEKKEINITEIKEFNDKFIQDNLLECKLNEDDILFLLNLFFDREGKNEILINAFLLCYNILLFNLSINKDEYDENIKHLIKEMNEKHNFTKNKFSNFYSLKIFDDENDIKNIYFNKNKNNMEEIKKFNIKIDSIKSLEDNLENILNIFGPFCIAYKKIEYLLEEYFNSLNKKSENISDFLNGYSLEDHIKNIIIFENKDVIQIPNLYYFLNLDINIIEFDFICLIKKNTILTFNKNIFERVSYIHNLKLLDNIDDINGLSLIFFEIKTSQQSTKDIAKHLLNKVNFLYPLFEKFMLKTHGINIKDCKLYFIYVFNSKFNPKNFGTPTINEIKSNINNYKITNTCKFIYIHVETNIGQYNIKSLKQQINAQNSVINDQNKVINNQNKVINNQNNVINDQNNKIIELEKKISKLEEIVANIQKSNKTQNNSGIIEPKK